MVILNLMSLFVAVEEVADRLVAAGIPTQRFVPVRIRHRPAVEYEAPAVAGFVLRQPALVREGCDRVRNHDFLPPLRCVTLPFFLAEESLRLGCTGDIKVSISAES